MGVALKDTADVPVTFMDPGDKRSALLELTRLEAQLSALKLRVMAVSDDVALAEGARDVGALLAHETRTDSATTGVTWRSPKHWTGAGPVWPPRSAQGDLNMAQAAVITHALEELPAAKLSAELLAQAEAHLVAEAAHFGPRELRVLGRRILDILAPEIFEQHEAEQLAEEERRAERRTSLVSTRLGDGTTRITINLPDAVATRLHTYLEAFTSPRHARSPGTEADRIPVDRKRGQAFCALLEAVDPKRLPAHGGDATTLIVTVSLDDLRKELGTAELGPADKLTAGEVRRLACTAKIIPAVLDGKSEVLDLGRTSRLFKPAQRKAMIIRDRRVPRRGMHHPGSLVRGPPLGKTLGRRWPHRPQGRRTPVQLAPPPRPRHHLRQQPNAQRRRAVQPANVSLIQERCALALQTWPPRRCEHRGCPHHHRHRPLGAEPALLPGPVVGHEAEVARHQRGAGAEQAPSVGPQCCHRG